MKSKPSVQPRMSTNLQSATKRIEAPIKRFFSGERRIFSETEWKHFHCLLAIGLLSQGCCTVQPAREHERAIPKADVQVDFSDPLLNHREILLFGSIDGAAAERTIQKLLFLDRESHSMKGQQ